LPGDFFVAAALDQQIQDLPVAGRNFDLVKTQGALPPEVEYPRERFAYQHALRQSFAYVTKRLRLAGACT
jgi:hypothetical protein